jgi:sulfatase modifying factor 1
MIPKPTFLSAFLLLTAPAMAAEPVAIGDRFRIDRTEVTIGQFRAFARSKGIKTAAELEGGGFEYGAGWERRAGWSVYRPFGEEPSSADEPAVHVSWPEARDFCATRGGRLPTAEQWRMAAYTETRGRPTSGFETGLTYSYPTGAAPQGLNTAGDDRWPRHAAAGETASGVNGLTEMGGNVWEWLADRQGDDALTAGGSWWYGPDKAMNSAMQWKPASFYAVYVGFRCAYDLK